MLLKLLNLDFLCICFMADFHDFHSRGWSPSSDWGIYSLSPVWMAWPAVRCQFVLWCGLVFFFPSWGTWRTSQLILAELLGSLFFQSFMPFTIHTVCPSPELMHVAALRVLDHSLQPFDVTSLTTSDLLLYLNYDALVQRMRWLTGGCSTLKFSAPN